MIITPNSLRLAAALAAAAVTGCGPFCPIPGPCIGGTPLPWVAAQNERLAANTSAKLAACRERTQGVCYADPAGNIISSPPDFQAANLSCEQTTASSIVSQGIKFSCFRDQLGQVIAYRPGIDETPTPPTPEEIATEKKLHNLRAWCSSADAQAEMRAEIPQLLDLSDNAAAVTEIKLEVSLVHLSRVTGKPVGTRCFVRITFSNGYQTWVTYDRWTDRYGQPRVALEAPGDYSNDFQ